METMNLLWIIPLSAMAGGFLFCVLLVCMLMKNISARKNGSDSHESEEFHDIDQEK